MNIEKAVGFLYFLADQISRQKFVDGDAVYSLKAGARALEKTIPMRPRVNGSYESADCPVCGRRVGKYTFKADKLQGAKYCGGCGQAIDWSDLE